MASESSIDPWTFRRASLLYPLPVAMACGRVLRARTPQEKIDACLKAGEVLARYLAAVSLSSFAARAEQDDRKVQTLSGNLAFGHFLGLVQQIANLTIEHPAAPHLVAGFRAKKRGKEQRPAPTDDSLIALLGLRNDLGHQLLNLTEARATAILAKDNPEKRLADALGGVEALLCIPLFVVEDQWPVKKVPHARRLLLMGESADPGPEEISLSEFFEETRVPYIAIGNSVLKLPPCLIWELVEERANYRLLFLDGVGENQVRYRTIEANEKTGGAEIVAELHALSGGTRREQEHITLRDGRTLGSEWGERRKLLEEAGRRGEGRIPWDQMDDTTLGWFAARLDGKDGASPIEAIAGPLLDERTNVGVDELRQLILLFGKPSAVRQELRRDIMDLRAVRNPESRWDERLLIENDNILQTLRKAVDFFSRHIGAEGVTIDGLASTSGSADYLAIREALINQLIHQDYTDPSAAAQVEIQPETTVLFNTGYSLVEKDRLVEGGKSQSRNPLVARALRLIGFAELAGSGIRTLQYAWRDAQRRPPRFESDRKANTFTLTLDWRTIPNEYDEYWKKRLGVKLTAEQAVAFNLAQAPAGITVAEVASAINGNLDDARAALEHLVRQALVEQQGERFVLKEHLRGIL